MKPTPPHERSTYQRSRAVRLDSYDYRRTAMIHLTLCAAEARPFESAPVCELVCASVTEACDLCKYRLFGFCLMPDHLHVLLDPADWDSPVGDWLRRFKSFTTVAFHRIGGYGDLWQRSAYDHVCRRDETAETVLAYIIENPVRAGLVECWEAWPWTKVLIRF